MIAAIEALRTIDGDRAAERCVREDVIQRTYRAEHWQMRQQPEDI